MYRGGESSSNRGNGAHAQQLGVITSANFIGKQQPVFNSFDMSEEDELSRSSLQSCANKSSSSTSPPSSSPLSHTTTIAKPNDVAQVMASAMAATAPVNGLIKSKEMNTCHYSSFSYICILMHVPIFGLISRSRFSSNYHSGSGTRHSP